MGLLPSKEQALTKSERVIRDNSFIDRFSEKLCDAIVTYKYNYNYLTPTLMFTCSDDLKPNNCRACHTGDITKISSVRMLKFKNFTEEITNAFLNPVRFICTQHEAPHALPLIYLRESKWGTPITDRWQQEELSTWHQHHTLIDHYTPPAIYFSKVLF